MEASNLTAQSRRILSEETIETMSKIKNLTNSSHLAVNYILGEQYIEALKEMAHSENAKIILLPPDILKTIETMLTKK